MEELDRHLPPTLKAASAKAYDVAREIAGEAQRSGVTGAARAAYGKVEPAAKDAYYGRIEPAAKDLYVRYEPAAEHLAVSVWRSLNGLPLFPQVAQIVVPTAAYWCEKYNRVIAYAAGHGVPAARYLPAIPVERIAKVFGEEAESSEESKQPMGLDATVGEGSSESESKQPMGPDATVGEGSSGSEEVDETVGEPAPESKPMGLDAQI